MKKAFIFIYILAILLISGFAKAQNPMIEKIQYSPETLKFQVSGQHTYFCKSEFKPIVVSQQVIENNVLVKNVVVRPSRPCIELLNSAQPFDLTFDARDLNLLPNQKTIVRFQNVNTELTQNVFEISIDDSVATEVGVEKVEFAGQLVKLATGGYAIADDSQAFKVVSEFDLERYVGSDVSIIGTDFVYQVAPVLEVGSVDIDNFSNLKEKSAIFVLEIKSISK